MSPAERDELIRWPEPLPRQDETDDATFYTPTRLVTHIDDGAIEAVTALYREYLPAGGRILDLMSSWISHLPPEARYTEVVGLGMNAAELMRNPRLDRFVVQDLNKDTALVFETAYFDGAVICVSIDYLIRPTAVLVELARVVKPGGVLVVSFSNRCFPTKAVLPWLYLDDAGHVEFVKARIRAASGWVDLGSIDGRPAGGDPLFAVIARRGDSIQAVQGAALRQCKQP